MNPTPVDERAQLEALVADVATGIVTLGPDGLLRYANHAALALHDAEARLEPIELPDIAPLTDHQLG